MLKGRLQELQKLVQMSGLPAAARATQSRWGVAAQGTDQNMHSLLCTDTAQDMQAVMHIPDNPAAASTRPVSGRCRLHGPMLAHQYLEVMQAS